MLLTAVVGPQEDSSWFGRMDTGTGERRCDCWNQYAEDNTRVCYTVRGQIGDSSFNDRSSRLAIELRRRDLHQIVRCCGELGTQWLMFIDGRRDVEEKG